MSNVLSFITFFLKQRRSWPNHPLKTHSHCVLNKGPNVSSSARSFFSPVDIGNRYVTHCRTLDLMKWTGGLMRAIRETLQDIPSLTAEAAKDHPGISYIITAPLGLHEQLVVSISKAYFFLVSNRKRMKISIDMKSKVWHQY